MEKKCVVCNCEFSTVSESRLYCTIRCRKKADNIRQRIKSGNIFKIISCVNCGSQFKQRNVNQKYCSSICRNKYYISQRPPVFKKEVLNPVKARKKYYFICLKCGKHQETLSSNKKYCNESCRNRSKEYRDRNKSKVELKPCEFCGFDDSRAIHRHHIKQTSNRVIFLCANHHSIYHRIVGASVKANAATKQEVLTVLKNGE